MTTIVAAAQSNSQRPLLRSAFARTCQALCALVAVVCAVWSAVPACAQSSRDIVGGPITTQRLERFLNAYVAPTDAEAAAMDRLHESYLDRYRAEIEPEASALMSSMSGGQPSKDEFEKFLRSLDRMQDKIAEADNQFLASATELLAESRRGGMQRVREARERQRLLSGIVQFAPMMLGGGAGFIDLPARAIRDEYFSKVPQENREAFDAALRSQEQRTLGQAREYNSEVRKALSGFFDVMTSMQEAMQEAASAIDPNNPESFGAMEAQQRAMTEKLAVLGAEVRKTVKANFEANRTGAAALAALLPEEAGVLLRLDLADASVNSVGFAAGQGSVSRTRMRTLGGRIERDQEITPEVKVEIANILKSWRRDQAQASEKLAEAMLDAPAGFGMFGASSESQTVDAARRQYREVGNTALKQIAAKLLDKSSRYVTSSTGFEEDGTEVELFRVASVPKAEADADEAAILNEARSRSQFAESNVGQSLDPLTTADVVRVAQTLGIDSSSQAVIEAVVDGWKSSQWDAQLAPLEARMLEVARGRMSTDGGGMIVYDDALVREYEALRLRVVALAFECDEKLYTDLASALGLAADDALLTLLRLERTDVAVSRAMGPTGSAGIPLPLSRILARAKVDPAIARTVLEGAKTEVAALANSMPTRVRERVELAHRQGATERVFASRDPAAVERASREYGELILKASETDRAFGELLMKIFIDAFKAHAGDASVAENVRRAVLASAHPEVYKRADSAQGQLDAAQSLSGLSDDQRARIAALAAEYAVVFEKLSEAMIVPPVDMATVAQDEATWAEYQKRAEAIEKARFSRNERTEKALAELRRIVGADNATLVPGLVKGDEVSSDDDEDMNMWMRRDDD